MEDVLRIGLLDDEESPRILLSEIIALIPGYEISFSTDDPFLTLELIKNGKIDILITDIMIPGFSGLELSKKILHLDIPVIICSAHDRFGVESFKVNTVYFILKPPSFFEVSFALEKARATFIKYKPLANPNFEDIVRIREYNEFKIALIKPTEIQYIEQKESFTWIFLESGKTITTRDKFYNTLEKIERPYIFRIHRSFAVNYLKMRYLDQGYCHFDNGVRIPIGSTYREAFENFLQNKTVI
ncbi:two component transcriptional regulator, LytTR family [Algoriphagus alkaliphilus]|uniref:Two component transcriptional regulator, LytTR family n=2 Tax=Algoriphagus alkaliphilus TaxID=279824 RepID=A0A1G5Z924_9BACT|nr:two component transcriptional regulator, LytTR family [Algoriphagus alkaliphilus]